MSQQDQGDQELQVFDAFLTARGITAAPGSVTKRNPPEPDLLFRQSDGSVVAYELVELLDEDWARTMGGRAGLERALRDHLEALPATVAARFKAKYGDADLSLFFSERTSSNQRRQLIPRIFEKLLDLPDRHTGSVFERDPAFAGMLRSIWIGRRPALPGPLFNPDASAWVGDPTVPAIGKKFRKAFATAYVTPHPMELLAYIDGNPMFPESVWRPALEELVDSQVDRLPFRRVWVFDCGKGEVCFTHG